MNFWIPFHHRQVPLLTSSLCWPVSSRAGAGDLLENDLDVVWWVTHTISILLKCMLELSQQQLSHSLSPEVTAGAMCLSEKQWMVQWKTRVWKEPSGPKCRSSGSHTSLAPPSKASTLWVFFLNNLQTLCSHDERTSENLVSDCFQGLVDATFWAHVWVFCTVEFIQFGSWRKISLQGSIHTYLIYKYQNQPDDLSRSIVCVYI